MWIKICAEEELLQVKILFEEVSLKARFEGRDKRAVRESERKRIPSYVLCLHCQYMQGDFTENTRSVTLL